MRVVLYSVHVVFPFLLKGVCSFAKGKEPEQTAVDGRGKAELPGVAVWLLEARAHDRLALA